MCDIKKKECHKKNIVKIHKIRHEKKYVMQKVCIVLHSTRNFYKWEMKGIFLF